ncbi:MAG: exonuclease domain-containing protein, partial [Planctomycetota bacterium]
RPDPFFFTEGTIQVHGILPADVEDKPTFAQLWSEIKPVVTGSPLIAHNAMFDLGVLTGCLKRANLDVPPVTYNCTRLISKRAWPRRLRYGLRPCADELGIQFRHHDALEDALTCAKILLAAAESVQCERLDACETVLGVKRGYVKNAQLRNPCFVPKKSLPRRLRVRSREHQPTLFS